MPWEKHAYICSEKYVVPLFIDPCNSLSLDRNSPSNYVDKWSTPMLIIHGGKDYSVPETEAIGAFHALQQ
jgi:dipeptidyl aminopeptidase/acylaminoacyl peptidase